ncbi:MAG: substrate-binding domain-containing protein [Desmonostoc vinosum HA7617-LM4]|nr:substrate-binding domain-containing protein [Desmonostoc vinosum HA7617-LM4]
MWQREKKDNSIVSLALWLALAATPMTGSLLISAPMLAQSSPETPAFPLPQSVENGTVVRIDGSSSLTTINQSLKENFEKQYPGTKVEIAASGTDTALQALLDGKIDVAAIGRGLTPQEKAKGLEQLRLRREKIAIIVSQDNPFKQSLTTRQFARIFRGDITDWSELGGPAGKIRVIDRPATSDTRETFRDYPAFKTRKFTTGANSTQLAKDDTAEIIKQLGKDGISYVLANQVSKLQGVRVLPLHQTLPDDPKYPFSQPLVYVYKKNPSTSITAFLAFTLAPPGQQAIETARVAEAQAIASGISPTLAAIPTTTTSPSAEATPNSSVSPGAETTPNATAPAGEQPMVAPATNSPNVTKETPFWLLLPLFIAAVGGFVLWWLLRKRPSLAEETASGVSLAAADNDEPISFDSSFSNSQEEGDHTAFSIYNQTPSNLSENGTQTSPHLAHETANATSKLTEATNGVSNTAAALGGGAVLATGIGAGIWSKISGKDRESTVENTSSQSGEVAWDIEAPAAVVNTPYTQLPNIPEEAPQTKLPTTVTTASLPKIPGIPEVTDDEDYWETEETKTLINSQPPAESTPPENINSTEEVTSANTIDNMPDVIFDTEWLSPEVTSSLSELPNLPEDTFNVVADAAEPIIELPEIDTVAQLPEQTTEPESNWPEDNIEANPTDSTSDAVLTAGAGIGAWATIYGIQETPVPYVPAQSHSQVDDIPVVEEAVDLPDNEDYSRITLSPRTPKWAYVFWHISDTDKEALQPQGDYQLVVRLYDVTDIDLSYQSPLLVQQYECEEATHDRFVAIPASDRDYMIEIGYISNGNWSFITRSVTTHIFSRPYGEFWFEADAELVIHGSTVPNTTVSIGGHAIKLKPDGTFHLRIPFPESLMDYPIKVVSADGEQTKTIHKRFSQETSED